MLRRKMVLVLSTLLLLLVGTGVGAVAALQGMLPLLRSHAEMDHAALISHFRWLVLGLAVVFLVVINISAIVLFRTAAMILRPVEELIDATRELAQEHFAYRVVNPPADEFGELARAFNGLAEQLQANEQRKLEMLGQVALTLNHELNNAGAIIELQLQLLSRQASGANGVEKYARQIREGLARMTKTVDALKHVRRIVLTDYASGMKMLDLERSVRDGDDPPTAAPAVPGVHPN